MNRPIIYSDEQIRTYDFLTGFREALYGLGIGLQDVLGSTGPLITGLNASAPGGLSVALSAGRILSTTAVDAVAYSDAGIDSRTAYQHGECAAQTLTFSTAGLSAGQSRYALVQATFAAVDSVPSDDPNGGILPYYDVDDPGNSLSGPSGTGTLQPTRRSGKCVVSIKYGPAASTGAEVAPAPDGGYAPLYLVDLTYGQTAVASTQIVRHPAAPFLSGLLASHHGGVAGQAPKIDLTAEIKNVLPLANLPAIPMAKLTGASSTNSGGGISTTYTFAGNPNGNLDGVAGVVGVSPPDTCWDSANGVLYICTQSGTDGWTAINGGISGGTATFGNGSVGSQSSFACPAWLLSGMILKCGIAPAHSENNGAFSVSFTSPFPTACIWGGALGKINQTSNKDYDHIADLVSFSRTGITLFVNAAHDDNESLSFPVSWIAIGN